MKKTLLYIIGLVSPKSVSKILFRHAFHRSLNIKNPVDLNEKIQWIKFYGDTSLWADLSDKYKVREYIKSQGYQDTLIPLLGHWDNADNIEWDTLPDCFVLLHKLAIFCRKYLHLKILLVPDECVPA